MNASMDEKTRKIRMHRIRIAVGIFLGFAFPPIWILTYFEMKELQKLLNEA
jgi:hypothetical protein